MQPLSTAIDAFPGLHASAPQTLPFAPSLSIRAFLLRRERGNLLLYSVDGLASQAKAFQDLGGVTRQYLNHWHEALFASDRPDTPLFCHEKERDAVAEKTAVSETFSAGHRLDDDFEAIPIPGHTAGATAYLWTPGDHRFLFTGDSIFLRDGEWVAAVLESSDRARYIESLERIRAVEFDVLVPWAATGGQPYHALTDPSDARRRIDAILDRLRRGEDH